MKPWVHLGSAPVPGSPDELQLWQRDTEFSIRVRGTPYDLMNSRQHGSEEALADLALTGLGAAAPRVLIGGLGMGFTLAAALRTLPGAAQVTVAELVPEVVTWNHGPLGEVAGHPLRDPRVTVAVADVAELMRAHPAGFDAILLDVDNGPEGMTRAANDALYGPRGLATARVALRPGGVLAVWSVEHVPRFTDALTRTGFTTQVHHPRARHGKGGKHTVWTGRKGG
ncbi:hypothetical protein [Deinococcus sp. PEB2-63]